MNKLFEQLVEKRGIKEDFLHPKYETLGDPFLLPDMEKAVKRIEEAVQKNERVLIYGDYDADGVTSSTLMEEALMLAGVNDIEIMLPDRFMDGYGMSPRLVKRAKDEDRTLVVTVDCGSANKEIVAELNELGIDTIVTDHHECPDELPEAVAVVNPKRKDYEGFRDLAGVGVAFKVAQALMKHGKIAEGREKWMLDLVLIGTVCDSMPLENENRILSFYGMKVLSKTRRVGLQQLLKNAGVKRLNAEAIGFQIGPRLNAAGRIESADLALNLLRTKSRVEAAKLGEKLEELNKKRRDEQKLAVKEIAERGIKDDPVIIETGKWHEGILGIIAGRLVEEYKKPAFVLSEVSDGIFKGSGRSFGEFNLAEALNFSRDSIINGGGHAAAAGVKVSGEKLWEFREKINEYYRSLKLEDQERFLKKKADIETEDLGDFNLELLEELEQLQPFGDGNAEPIFELRNVEIAEVRRLGEEGKHLSLLVRGKDDKTLKLLAFSAPKKWLNFEPGDKANILIQIMENEWNGVRSLEGRILDVCYN